jgi:murein DD-endopeptidase MepM/ murein hydrolase activator NlpD
MGARYYNSNYGRFISEDLMFWTLPKVYLLDPQQMNSYAYARNNPIIYTDPDGKTAVDSINNFINNTLSNVASSVNNFLGGGGDKNSDKLKNSRPVLDSPVGNAQITSMFMSDRSSCSVCSKTHGGTDYSVETDTPVHATASGNVIRSDYSEKGYGNVIIIDHGKSLSKETKGEVFTLYGHGNSLEKKVGDYVNSGDVIMYSGNTGNTTNPHLHYEVIVTPEMYPQNFYSNLNIRYNPFQLKNFLSN